MAAIDSLYKFASTEQAELILTTGKLRWSSPELFNEPWAIKYNPKLGFDHKSVSKAMLKAAVAMIFTREMPPGNQEHPLYKAIKRWRQEDRFKDEVEAFEALSELLAPTPDTLKEKFKNIIIAWKELIANSRILCLSENVKDLQCWKQYGDNHRGLALKFELARLGSIKNPKRVEYTTQRCQLTSVKEQVNDLVGIKRAAMLANFESKLLTKSKCEASEKEWRCIRTLKEEELDCGEELKDWFIDEPFQASELAAVYFGFLMPEAERRAIIKILKADYPSVLVFSANPTTEHYELEFKRIVK